MVNVRTFLLFIEVAKYLGNRFLSINWTHTKAARGTRRFSNVELILRSCNKCKVYFKRSGSRNQNLIKKKCHQYESLWNFEWNVFLVPMLLPLLRTSIECAEFRSAAKFNACWSSILNRNHNIYFYVFFLMIQTKKGPFLEKLFR